MTEAPQAPGTDRTDGPDGTEAPEATGDHEAAHLRPADVPAWRRLFGASPTPVARGVLERRRVWTIAALGGAVAVGAGLSLVGASVVRNSTAGRYVAPPVGPDEPGYQAYVVATPTLAVLQPGADGDLASVALLSLLPGDDGGAVTLLPVSTLGPDVAGATVAEAYEDGGAGAAVEALGELLGVAVDGGVELDGDGWAELVAASGPVTVGLSAPAGPYPAGDVSVTPAQAEDFLLDDQPGEGDLDRLARQAAFWDAWLPLVAEGGEEALPDDGDVDADLARFVTGIARGASTEVLPVVASEEGDTAGGTAYEAEPVATSELIARAVPYPLSPAPGRRVRVRLLNGTPDPDLTAEVVPLLVAAGAEITIAGNASSFDVTETTTTYTDPEVEADAEGLAGALGVGTVERGEQAPTTSQPDGAEGDAEGAEDQIEDEIDMTIVLGSDARDLIRRLESAG